MKRYLGLLIPLAMLASCASAQPAATPAAASSPSSASASASPSSASASAPASAPAVTTDPAVMRILKQLEASGEQFTTIEAKLTYTVEDRKLGDVEERTGFVAYEKKSKDAPAKFRVTFDTLRQGEGPRIREQEDFAFDGQWVTLRKHKIKQMTRGQVAGEGEQVEPLRLGKGMFPLPFGQKAADVLEFFDVSQGPEDADASGNADCLILTPRREKAEDVSFSEMRMWIDRSTHLPVKMITRDDKKKVTTVVFGDIRTNQPLAADIFDLPRPAGWELRVEDWRKKAD